MTQSPQTNAKGFSKAFWVSNTVELFERMAYYAVFIVLTIYLSNILGFNDFEASMISGLFSGGLYLLPIFTGAYADKIGFRKSMIIAFSLLSAGYLGLGVLPTLLEAAGLVEYGEVTRFSGLADSSERWMIVPVLFVIMLGGSFIKSIISASVAKETTEATRARGYSIFYMMVNFGAFTGKTIIDPLRNAIGEQAYIYINFFSATMTILALLSVVLLYKSAHTAGEGKSMREIGQGFLRIITNWRLLILILIVTGFWMVQQQLYATMPKYVIRMAGETGQAGLDSQCKSFCCGLLCKFHHQVDGKAYGYYVHEHRYVPDSCFRVTDGVWKPAGQRDYFRHEQYYIDDDTRYCSSSFGGMLYFSALSGIFLFTGS